MRFLGNWSSGRQGYAFAETAVARGAKVTLVAANVTLPDPAGTRVIAVTSAREMRDAMLAEAADADAVVMAAAVADFRPEVRSEAKIKKDGSQPAPIILIQNPDILAELSARRGAAAGSPYPPHEAGAPPVPDAAGAPPVPDEAAAPPVPHAAGAPPAPHAAGAPPVPHEAGAPPVPHEAGALPGASRPGQVIVGFAAETELDLAGSRAKLARKGCDLLVVNRVGNGLAFGTSDNEAVVVGADGSQTDIPRAAKEVLADTVWDLVAARLCGDMPGTF